MKYFYAQDEGKKRGITGDVLTRDSQTSVGYWEITQDALSDLVRVMLSRCFDSENYPELYNHCRNLRGQVWLCAFPNLFITIAPAEWKFPRPYFYSLIFLLFSQVLIFWPYICITWFVAFGCSLQTVLGTNILLCMSGA